MLVDRIETFEKEKGRLSENLLEVNYIVKDGIDEIYYQKYSNNNYILSFIMSMDYNKTYYSDIKQWDYGYRKME